MVFWVILVAITISVTAIALWPLYKSGDPSGLSDGQDTEIYKDQMHGVEVDLAGGLIAEAEADAARAEIGRRLLAANQSESAATGNSNWGHNRSVAWVTAAGIAVFGFGIYFLLGAPELPDRPLAARKQAPLQSQRIETLISQVEAHLDKNPEDGKGWEVLGPVYYRIGRYEDARTAYRNTIRLLGTTAEREADLAEAIVAQNDGMVTAEARSGFERSLKMEPDAIRPRFFLAMALSQETRHEEAADAWRALLKEARGDEPWAAVAKSQLDRSRMALGEDIPESETTTTARAGAATPEAAVESMSPADRQQMIEGMVSGLAERLNAEGGSIEEWLKLVRSYSVLGNKDEARSAARRAKSQFAENSDALKQIDNLIDKLGLAL